MIVASCIHIVVVYKQGYLEYDTAVSSVSSKVKGMYVCMHACMYV